jgi:lipopolysaccharide heptosyltransferase I
MPSLQCREFERILLIKPSAVGDVIHTIPVLVKLRERYPQARIDWLLTPPIAELIGHHPALSNVVLFARKEYARFWHSRRVAGQMMQFLRDLRKPRYDLVIDLHGQFRSALLALITGARVRIGFDRPRKEVREVGRKLVKEAYIHGWTGTREGAWRAYTHRIPIPTLDVHAIDRYLWVGGFLGFDDRPIDMRIPVPPAAVQRVDELLASRRLLGKPLAILVPGTIWETKHWHVEGFAETARHLVKTGHTVVLAGTSSERERCRAVAILCPEVLDLAAQTTLSELAALIQRARICVTNDSGSMHLTVALGRPVVSVFGPTDPVWIGPYGRTNAVVQAPTECAPCYLRDLKHCHHGHSCMRQVSSAMVIERIEQVLASWDRQRAAG